MEEQIKPIKRYECANCGVVIDLPIDQELTSKCCKSPNHILILFEDSDIIRYNIGKVYENIQEIIKIYMDMPEKQIKIISLWILGTYFHESFDAYPYLYINAMRGSGKTRLLKLISNLSYQGKGKVYSGIRETLLFRTPKHHTLVFDELESIGNNDKASLREYLNASYKKGVTISRAKKVKSKSEESFVLEDFEPYKPIAMANIWGMDDVLGDRCLTFILEKSDNPAKTKLIENFDKLEIIKSIKRTLSVFSVVSAVLLGKKQYDNLWNNYIFNKHYTQYATTLTTLTTITTQTTLTNLNLLDTLKNEEFFNRIDESGIEGRNLELFLPLFILMNWLDEFGFKEILDISKEMVVEKKEEAYNENVDILVYQHIAENKNIFDYVSIKELNKSFREFYGAEEYEHKWINERWFGRSLKRLGLVIDKKRIGSGILVRLNISKAKEKLKIFKKEER